MIMCREALLGWGKFEYEVRKREYIASGRFSDFIGNLYTPAHNESLFDAWSKRGAFGLIALSCFFYCPLGRFTKDFQRGNWNTLAGYSAGVDRTCRLALFFQCPRASFSHNSGAMVYLLHGCYSLGIGFQPITHADNSSGQPKPR